MVGSKGDRLGVSEGVQVAPVVVGVCEGENITGAFVVTVMAELDPLRVVMLCDKIPSATKLPTTPAKITVTKAH